jgi:hypothetical protein|nr:MAG TPA: hypothetical protein [Caudoviricetes sp.]
MALTTTEENQLRELLRRANATQAGKTASQLPQASGILTVGHYIAKSYDSDALTTVPRNVVVSDLLDTEPLAAARNSQVAGSTNHLMTRNATRSEITSMTDARITSAQNTANSAVTANAATLQLAQGTEARARALESWRDSTVTPGLASRVRVAGGAYTTDPVIFIGPTNPAGTDIASRTHRFPRPMANDPMVFFSLVGDVNYPRYEWLRENGKVSGFVMFHSPTAGRWMAIGNLA